MNIVCMSEELGIIDIAFQSGKPHEQARDAHHFVSMFYDLTPRTPSYVVEVRENDSYWFVRVEAGADFHFARKCVFTTMIAIDPACDTTVKR